MSIRTLGSACNQAGQVERYLGTAYDTVKKVADNIDKVELVHEMLAKYGVLLCFDDAAMLKTIDPKLATFARVYDTRDALNLYYKDYIYKADTTDGLAAKGGIGAWVEMDSINSVFGQMAWVYNEGSAVGGETMLELDIESLTVTDLYINGSYQTYGLNFTFDPAKQVITLSQELMPDDMVVAKLSGVPALAPGSSVDNFHFLNFVYNEGSANGGETVISTGIPFMNITSVFKNGKRMLLGKDFDYSATSYTITFTAPLARFDEVQATLGGNLDEMSETVGALASKTVKYYQLAKDLIDAFGLAESDARGYANNSIEAAASSEASAKSASESAANAVLTVAGAAGHADAAAASAASADKSSVSASNSAQQAQKSASVAESNAASAGSSASSAADSASTASTKASAAASSATAASASENQAATDASNAATSATNAGQQADLALQRANSAANSQSTASSAADTATQKATGAAASADAAAASAANLSTSEKNAKTSETNAAASAKAAKDSEDKAVAAGASYSNLQSSDAGKGDALITVMAPYTGSVAITQDVKNQQSVYAPEMGLVPGTVVQDKFNAALLAAAGAGKELVVPAGVYTISGSIRLPSNTRLRLEPGCVIQRDSSGTSFRVMMVNRSDGTIGGYAANQNILVYGGGTIDGNSAMSGTGCALVAFSHCTNVLITDIDLNNAGTTAHALEFNACQNAFGVNVRANGCGNPTLITNEAFQVDSAVNNVTFPWFGPYDNTACDHVGFINCYAIGYGVGIGTNSDGSINHKNIILRDNRLFTNICGINMTGWDNVNVENNEVKWGGLAGTAMVAAIQATFNTRSGVTLGSTNLNMKNNYLHDIMPADLTIDPGTEWYGIKLIGSSADVTRVRDLILHHNHIENTGNSAITGQYVLNVLLNGNRLGEPKCTGATGLESLDLKDSTRIQVITNRMEGSVTVGKGTLTNQLYLFKDNWIGGALAANTALFAKGSITGNHAVTAVPATVSETARIVANNTVG